MQESKLFMGGGGPKKHGNNEQHLYDLERCESFLYQDII
jgi:hypothetical protein